MGEIKIFLCAYLEREANWTSQWRGSSGPQKGSRCKSGKPYQALGCQLWDWKWPGGGMCVQVGDRPGQSGQPRWGRAEGGREA